MDYGSRDCTPSPTLVEQRIGDRCQDCPVGLEDLYIVPTDIGHPISSDRGVESFIGRTFGARTRLCIEQETRSCLMGETDEGRSSIIAPNVGDYNITSLQGTRCLRCWYRRRSNCHPIGIGIGRNGFALCIHNERRTAHHRKVREPTDGRDRFPL